MGQCLILSKERKIGVDLGGLLIEVTRTNVRVANVLAILTTRHNAQLRVNL